MASLSSPTLIEAPDPTPVPTKPRASASTGGLLVVGLADLVAADYVAFAGRGGRDDIVLVADEALSRDRLGPLDDGFASLVIFLKPKLAPGERRTLKAIVALAVERRPEFVCIVSPGEPHGENDGGTDVGYVLSRLQERRARRDIPARARSKPPLASLRRAEAVRAVLSAAAPADTRMLRRWR